jgi:hypothetical protein
MGYDLHIACRPSWYRAARPILAERWLERVSQDSELTLAPAQGPYFALWRAGASAKDEWLDWREGEIFATNPSPALIDKMAAIARSFCAQLVGDDGEKYLSGNDPPIPAKPTLPDRFRFAIGNFFPRRRIERQASQFKVGDWVVDAHGREALVIEIDSGAHHNLGRIRIHYTGGTQVDLMQRASGLKPSRRISGSEAGISAFPQRER